MNTLKLYEAAEAITSLLDQIDPDSGEMPEELGEALAAFEGKGQAVTAYILNSEATAAAVETAAKKMQDRAKNIRKRIAVLETYLKQTMKRAGVKRIESDDHTFVAVLHLERDKAVEIFDERQIPSHLMRYPVAPDPEPNKAEIKSILINGKDVPGARLVKNDRLEIKS